MSNKSNIINAPLNIVDNIPNNWSSAKLVDICTPKQWKTISENFLESVGFRVYGANGFIGYYKEYNHEEETIAVTCRGATCGTVNLIPPKSYITGNAMCLDNIKKTIIKKYLFYAISFRTVSDVISGSAQPQITRDNLKSVDLPIPPITEQKKIVSILNSVDDVIEKTQSQIDKLYNLKKGMINKLLIKGIGHTEFKDSELGRIPKSWEIKKLEELVNHQRPITYGIVQTGENIIEGIPCVRVVDIVKNRPNPEHMIKTSQKISDSYKRTILQKNDILFALRGEIGHVVKTSNKIVGCNLTRGIALLSSSENIGSDFLIWALRSDKVRNEILDSVNGSALQEIPLGNLRKVTIPVPTPFEQNKIANILESINSKIESTNIKLSQTQSLKKSLMQDLLTGKVRVSVN